MTNTNDRPVLVLGATGKTGSSVAAALKQRGVSVRTAGRHDTDVQFDWDDPTTHAPALEGAGALYLLSPLMRTDYAPIVSEFLDKAERAGVSHVTYLSAYGMEHAPAEVVIRAVELDLESRSGLTHSFIRPSWFMQNFSTSFLTPVNDVIAVPNGDGAEAFVSTDDIASVAAATLADPAAHAGKSYAPTGPEALTIGQAAEIISAATGRTITYFPIEQDAWIDAMLGAGVPEDYAAILRLLTTTVASGNGSQPNGDIQAVTGRPATTFAEFAANAASVWT
ncbi:NmrA family NAD(P)-binding protein [Mycobacterium aquaticum]|uniref:NmrA family protein n=1 Tax=Mycobacterium aquaticum TaxID=1927124 RepID=A0A1X0A8C0_9MYCO|nr:NmrA family NAD(P)-binding protein [Mycobacterium aquaticum]ORA26310.1 NmrA family protein [Mycobacterium aquaticum]